MVKIKVALYLIFFVFGALGAAENPKGVKLVIKKFNQLYSIAADGKSEKLLFQFTDFTDISILVESENKEWLLLLAANAQAGNDGRMNIEERKVLFSVKKLKMIPSTKIHPDFLENKNLLKNPVFPSDAKGPFIPYRHVSEGNKKLYLNELLN